MPTTPQRTSAKDIEWGLAIVVAIAIGLLVLGARGLAARGHVGWPDGLRCALLLLPAGIYLLVTSYVVQHARLAAIIPLVAGVMQAFAHPSFAIALGLSLLWMTVGSPLLERLRIPGPAKADDGQS